MVLLLLFQMVTRTKKIFVGGLSATTTLEEVKAYFERFGDVSKILPEILALILGDVFPDWRRYAYAWQADEQTQVSSILDFIRIDVTDLYLSGVLDL